MCQRSHRDRTVICGHPAEVVASNEYSLCAEIPGSKRGQHPCRSAADNKYIRLLIRRVAHSKSDPGYGLHRITLERISVSELLEVFESDVYLCGQVQIRRKAESVGLIVCLRLFRCYRRSGLVSRLPCVIANETDLQTDALMDRNRLHHRIVKIHGLARMNIR